jgi:aspartyl-tRNA(Asn)/glutamyl-tRNA(Gln) amidotransferase subunit A
LTTKSELAFQPIAELGNLYREGSVSPHDVLDSLLENIRKSESRVHSFIFIESEGKLRTCADIASKSLKQGNGLRLTGVFLAIKDNTYVAGMPCTGGSKILGDFSPQSDANSVSRLRNEGAVFIGKTNLDEFAAFGISTNNPFFRRTFNPWNLGRIPGGSSGGSAASVASGEALGATGSDTGGSVRIPASFCNLVGLKPTFGSIGRTGTISMCWSLDHFGHITRTVRDSALLYEVLAGHDQSDSSTIATPRRVEPFVPSKSPELHGVKIGVLTNPLCSSDEEVSARFEESIRVFGELGASIREITFPDMEHVAPTIFAIALPEVAAYHEEWFRSKRDLYSPTLAGYVQLGHGILATQYLKAQKARTVIIERASSKLKEVDVLILPTNPSIAPELDQEFINIRGKEYPAFEVITENTYPFNLLGLPAISIPNGFSDGMPVGLEIVASHWKENLLFRVGDAFQQVTDFHKRLPQSQL